MIGGKPYNTCRLIFMVLYHFGCQNHLVFSTQSFVVSFQDSGDWSTNEWGKYKGEIPELLEFTTCHWQKIRYFSEDIMNVWSYCRTQDPSGRKINCTQLYQRDNPGTAGRQIILGGEILDKAESYETNVNSFRHRTWNHICFSYSSLKQNVKFHYNGKLLEIKSVSKATSLPGPEDVLDSSLIIGQEADILDGEFDVSQLFNGEISEFNMWKTVLEDGIILDLAQCSNTMRGDVVGWEIERFQIFGANVRNIDNAENHFCQRDPMFVIFPQRQPLNIARTLCATHGGKIITPKSSKENSEVMNILKKHSTTCLEDNVPHVANRDMAAWLGLTYKESIWYEVDDDKIIGNVSYSNWNNRPNETRDTSCAFLGKDGKWSFKTDEACFPNLVLCTVCEFSEFPVFTVNGLCSSLDTDFNYYLHLDDSNRISYYEGYKAYNLIKYNNTWMFEPKRGEQTSSKVFWKSENENSYPVGRSTWNIHAPICESKKEEKQLSFSKCEFGNEFTCNSGHCVALHKRCDFFFDCNDRSDEEGCKLIQKPDTYRKVQPPEPRNRSEALPITTEVEIITIDSIDAVNMLVGLTINIRVKWRDPRLTFANLVRGGKNIVQSNTVEELWIPLDYFIFENTIIGEIYKDSRYEVRVEALDSSLPKDPANVVQNRLFSGENNTLYITMRYRLKYNCKFWLRGFPFDRQNCPFIIQMKSDKITTVSLEKAQPPVRYDGPDVVEQFTIQNYTVVTNTNSRRTSFNLTITMVRVYTDQLITAFFPTSLLWILAYLTLFISLDDFSDRIMVSVTALLVLAALLSSINSSLPDTSYFKYIDLWFLWYTTNIFLITSFHIFLGTIEDEPKVFPSTTSNSHTRGLLIGKNKASKRSKVNNTAKIVVPITGLLFNSIYFYLQKIDN